MPLEALKSTFRQLGRQRFFALVNVLGLAVGLCAAIFILLFVTDEVGYDRHHEKADRIVRLVTDKKAGGTVHETALSSAAMGAVLEASLPEVEGFFRLTSYTGFFGPKVMIKGVGEDRFYEELLYFADPTIFEILDFEWLAGGPPSALDRPYTLVLSSDMARKYFGDGDAVGEVLIFNESETYTVTGVFEPMPRNSHLRTDFFLSFSTLDSLFAEVPHYLTEWQHLYYWTYLQLTPGASPEDVEAKLADLVERHAGGAELELSLQPLLDIHFGSNLAFELEPPGHPAYVYIPATVGVLILWIAGINFMNLATARAGQRAREIGVRKAMGATRLRLVGGLLGESLTLAFLGLAVAWIVALLLMPAAAELTGKNLTWRLLLQPHLLLALVGATLAVGIFAGSYPAAYLSGFRPVRVLKGDVSAGGRWSVRLRKSLVVVQFVLSVGLLVAAGIAFRQLDYLKNQRLGLDKQHVVVLPVQDETVREQHEAFLGALEGQNGVAGVTTSRAIPGGIVPGRRFSAPGPAGVQEHNLEMFTVGPDFLETLGIELGLGRGFSPDLASDEQGVVLVNEAAVRAYGWDSPLGTVLEKRSRPGEDDWSVRVIGVIRDFQFASLRRSIEPAIIQYSRRPLSYYFVRIGPEGVADTLDRLEQTWRDFSPVAPFEYFFLDETFDDLYRQEERLSRSLLLASGLAIFVGVLGLFGLAAFTAERRTQELGLRKALGATPGNIAKLLSLEFLQVVAAGTLIGWPLAYLAMRRWLSSFAFQVSLEAWIFVGAAGICALAALLAVGLQSLRSAMMPPMRALRHE